MIKQDDKALITRRTKIEFIVALNPRFILPISRIVAELLMIRNQVDFIGWNIKAWSRIECYRIEFNAIVIIIIQRTYLIETQLKIPCFTQKEKLTLSA